MHDDQRMTVRCRVADDVDKHPAHRPTHGPDFITKADNRLFPPSRILFIGHAEKPDGRRTSIDAHGAENAGSLSVRPIRKTVLKTLPDDRFDIVWILNAGGGPRRFSQLPQMLLADDKDSPIA